VLEQNLNVADKIRILHVLAYSESIDLGVPSSYKFEINSNGNKFNLDSAQFRGILKKTKKEQKSSRHSFFWTIDDSSLCP
jgi:hypothetical protein